MLSDSTEITASWTDLTKDLIDLGYQVWKVVAPVVASDSPEGHLPMDSVRFSFIILPVNKKFSDLSIVTHWNGLESEEC